MGGWEEWGGGAGGEEGGKGGGGGGKIIHGCRMGVETAGRGDTAGSDPSLLSGAR